MSEESLVDRRRVRGLKAKAQLIETAQKKCKTSGNFGTAAICKEAGLSRGALYHHFGSRGGLEEALWRETINELLELSRKELSANEPWQALVIWFKSLFNSMTAKRVWASATGSSPCRSV